MAATTARVEFRLQPEEKDLIEQAVRLLGMTITDVARPRLVQEARQIVTEYNITRLTNRDRDIFLAMLDADTEPNAALRKAFREVK